MTYQGEIDVYSCLMKSHNSWLPNFVQMAIFSFCLLTCRVGIQHQEEHWETIVMCVRHLGQSLHMADIFSLHQFTKKSRPQCQDSEKIALVLWF